MASSSLEVLKDFDLLDFDFLDLLPLVPHRDFDFDLLDFDFFDLLPLLLGGSASVELQTISRSNPQPVPCAQFLLNSRAVHSLAPRASQAWVASA